MSNNTLIIIIAGFVSGIVFFFSGFFMYTTVFGNFFLENLGEAQNAIKMPFDVKFIFLSNLSIGLLLSYILSISGNHSFLNLVKVSFLTSFLISCFMDFSFYGTTNIMNFNAILIDIFIISSTGTLSGIVAGLIQKKLIKKAVN